MKNIDMAALQKMLDDIKKGGVITINLNDPALLEALAEIEHEQWNHILGYLESKGMDPKAFCREDWTRWMQQKEKPYSELSEKEKESDRVWGKAVIASIANGNKTLFEVTV
jgi:hypothetical protein